ncbi:hypothetical protein BH11BAC5_BH11BAC5_10700 [soil metagenome]
MGEDTSHGSIASLALTGASRPDCNKLHFPEADVMYFLIRRNSGSRAVTLQVG